MYCIIPLLLGYVAGSSCNRRNNCCRRSCNCNVVNCWPKR